MARATSIKSLQDGTSRIRIPGHRICSPPPKPLAYQGFAENKWFDLEVYICI